MNMKVMMAIKCGYPEKWPSLFSENKVPRFWDMPQKWAPPENPKSFFPKTRYPVFGTCLKNGAKMAPKWPKWACMVSFSQNRFRISPDHKWCGVFRSKKVPQIT
jgi:hypothetical protein